MSPMSPSGPLASRFSASTSAPDPSSMRAAWPTSPNMTANRNGNVTIVSSAGLASLYRATPYASTMAWKQAVTLSVAKWVGGDS